MNECMKNTLILSAPKEFILQIYLKLNESIGIHIFMFFELLLCELELSMYFLNITWNF